ncbi:MAG TPA: A/G-specific adenine glycosylase [Actinomycetes bacterium]|nr:A/G-specific adenine glycosylase [Actinomycetes bacterium]
MGGDTLLEPVLAFYASQRRDLPWRRPDTTPWGVLVSEVMLQQTPVARVEPVWGAWVRRWPTPAALAVEPAGEAIRAWGRLGYPRRAIRLHAAARECVAEHRGDLPTTTAELRRLPGVGDYTAAAVAAFAFRRREVVLDTNVRRVLERVLGGRESPPGSGPSAVERKRAEALLPEDPEVAATWSVAVMELGALVCRARNPLCGCCPLLDACAWRAAGSPAGPARRAQTYDGTDRQVRGRLLALLRDASGPVSARTLRAAASDALQLKRSLDGLVADGLVVALDDGRYALPA